MNVLHTIKDALRRKVSAEELLPVVITMFALSVGVSLLVGMLLRWALRAVA